MPGCRSLWREAAAGTILLAMSSLSADELPLYRDPSKTTVERIEDLLARMTQAEKVGQLSQGVVRPGESEIAACIEPIRSGGVGSYILGLGVDDPTLRNRLQEVAIKESRLGIPLIFGFDTIHGFRSVFPIPLAISCAWDPGLFQELQAIAARESRAAGIDWVFGPMCDLARDPRWGRVAETFGEDPYLASLYATAGVRGLQGEDISQPDRVAACLKHFVGYSAAIGGRDYNHTEIPVFAMRNFFLPVFRAGVRAGAATVMTAFNANDGIPSSTNSYLLTQVLRNEWKFSGFVVSDWEAVAEAIRWGSAADEASAARMALAAGTDMEMVSTTYRDTLANQVSEGWISQAIIDQAVRRVLAIKFRLGLFERPLADANAFRTMMLRPDAVVLARKAAARSCVLLKNDALLPLAKSLKRIAILGPLADDREEMLGSWSGHGRATDVVSLAQGIRTKVPETEVEVVGGCGLLETPGALTDAKEVADETAMTYPSSTIDDAVRAASAADVCILALGEPRAWSGENASRAHLGLTGRQQHLLEAVAKTGKPIVVVLFCGRPLQLRAVLDKADSLLVAWHPGIQAGNAIADLLFGDSAPAGRLTMSFPLDVGQLPLYYNRYRTGKPEVTNYRDLTSAPLFPFGFGLTYTSFAFGPVELKPGKPVIASALVTNTGTRVGEEVVQLYIRDTACSEGARPQQELRGFQRITLQPRESREVHFELTDEVLGFFGRDGDWQVDPGSFQLWIAPHAETGNPANYEH
jgi:beta-glucosidase